MEDFINSIANALESFAPTLESAMPYIVIGLAIIIVILLIIMLVRYFIRKRSTKKKQQERIDQQRYLAAQRQEKTDCIQSALNEQPQSEQSQPTVPSKSTDLP